MSQRLPVISPREVIRAFGHAGWIVLPGRGKGSHTALHHPSRRVLLIVPSHNPVKRGTLRALIRQAEMTVDDFCGLL